MSFVNECPPCAKCDNATERSSIVVDEGHVTMCRNCGTLWFHAYPDSPSSPWYDEEADWPSPPPSPQVHGVDEEEQK